MSREIRPRPSFEIVEDPHGPGRELDGAGVGGVPAAAPDGPERQIPLRRYLTAVLRYKWWILLLTVAGTGAGFFMDMSNIMTPEYQAEATIWVENSGRDANQSGPIRSEELLRNTSWIDLLRSFMVLDPVVHEMQLLVMPVSSADSAVVAGIEVEEEFEPGAYVFRADPRAGTFVLETEDGATVERGVLGDSVGAPIGLRWLPDPALVRADRAVRFAVSSSRDASQRLGRRLYSELDRNGNFLRVRLRGTEPQQTAAVLNRVVDRYIDVAAELKSARLEEVVSILEEQLSYAERNLRAAEIALEDFRVQTITLPSDRSTPVAPGIEATSDPVISTFFQMRVELEQVRRSQDAVRRAMDPEAAQGLALQTLEAVGAVRQSSELTSAISELTSMKAERRALLYRYTEEHPPVQELTGNIERLERITIPALAEDLLAELTRREEQLQDRIDATSTELRQIPPRAIEEARLTRDVTIADNLFTTLQRRYEEARLGAASSFPDIRVLDRAVVPRQRLGGERTTPLALFAFLGSLGLGILGAIVRDRMDRRLRYPTQVTHDLGLTVLGAVPYVGGRRGKREEKRRQAVEAFRSIRLNLGHAYGAAGPVVLTVTSPGPGDGKSFVTANLALAFAQLGLRTVVIDADVRRGTIHHVLGGERIPGLTNFLRGTGEEPPIQGTSHENLWILTCGGRVLNGPELISSRAMRDLMMRLRAEYDVVLVDSPPLGAGADAYALGTLSGNSLLVLRTGITDRELADAKIDLLERLPIRLLGAVLNGVPSTREYRYYSYDPDYGITEGSGSELALALPGGSAK